MSPLNEWEQDKKIVFLWRSNVARRADGGDARKRRRLEALRIREFDAKLDCFKLGKSEKNCGVN